MQHVFLDYKNENGIYVSRYKRLSLSGSLFVVNTSVD